MNPSSVLIRAGALGDLPSHLPEAPRRFVVTDENVSRLLPAALSAWPRHVLRAGESSKNWASLGSLLETMSAAGLDRDAQLIGIGGGVVTDIGGLAASLHRRGIRWCAVPTTLIGQIDAAFGGKTAVNHGGAKNSVGAFHAPEAVIIDPDMLTSLPAAEIRAGLAEALKTALISGDALLDAVSGCQPADIAAGGPHIATLVERCLAVKLELVARDPFDEGDRQFLNLGHTFGHAFEALSLGDDETHAPHRAKGSTRRSLRHGEAVGLGLLCAARLAALTGGGPGLQSRLAAVLKRWELPVSASWHAEAVISQLIHDKKRRAGHLLFILPDAPGSIRLLRGPSKELLRSALEAVAAP